MKQILFVLFNVIGLCYFAQPNIPNKLPYETIEYLDKAKVKHTYKFSKHEKKAFLFFDIHTENAADLIANAASFVFRERKITLFPIYFSGQLMKKRADNIGTKIPTQLYRVPENSMFSNLNLKESDFPLLVVYDEKNELCGITKNFESVGDIACKTDTIKYKVLRLKLLVETNSGVKAYKDKPITVLSGIDNDTTATLVSNNDGEINIEIPDLTKNYVIKVKEEDKNIKFVVLGTQTGILLGKFKSNDEGFEYKVLQSKLITLPGIKEEDPIEKKFAELKTKRVSNFVITETLYYELGESELTKNSKELLEKIKNGLNSYPEYKLKIVSHTDSQGDDESNLNLSLKRSETVVKYLTSIGISSERLSAEGKGETEIRNRCVNGLECSDKEHEYNRRTEFKFSKK